jgi:hypothetical protein
MLALAGLLAGCVEPTASAPPPVAEHVVARREGVSPRGASLALASVGGVPDPVADRFKEAFTKEAGDREIKLADAKKAAYFMRGYLNASSSETGTTLSVVFDVFDGTKNRAQRIEDKVTVKGGAEDPWSLVDDGMMNKLVAKSAEDVAAFLTNTPEAIVAAEASEEKKTPEPRVAHASVDSGQTIVPQTTSSAPPPVGEQSAALR